VIDKICYCILAEEKNIDKLLCFTRNYINYYGSAKAYNLLAIIKKLEEIEATVDLCLEMLNDLCGENLTIRW
jgi:hypothetical protein